MVSHSPSYLQRLPDPWTPDAHLDPWVVVPVTGDQHVLFGFACEHPRTGGLSWMRSSPVKVLDLRHRRAVTLSGRLYDLGRRVRVHRVPSLGLEAWLAYDILVSPETEEELVPPISADHDRDTRWIAAQKAARHLGVQPPSHDPVEVERFVAQYQDQYLRKRRGGMAGP